jgi:hypothetical protein
VNLFYIIGHAYLNQTDLHSTNGFQNESDFD